MRDEFLAAMEPHVASTRDEPGCVFFEYHRHKNDEDVVVLIEGCLDAGRRPPDPSKVEYNRDCFR